MVTLWQQPDGSYQWVNGTYTPDDIEAAQAASDFATWASTNANVTPPQPEPAP
jgi:hypothetical protein